MLSIYQAVEPVKLPMFVRRLSFLHQAEVCELLFSAATMLLVAGSNLSYGLSRCFPASGGAGGVLILI